MKLQSGKGSSPPLTHIHINTHTHTQIPDQESAQITASLLFHSFGTTHKQTVRRGVHMTSYKKSGVGHYEGGEMRRHAGGG